MMSTSAHEQRGSSGDGGGLSPYARFAGMIATSTIVMFVLTYTNVFDVAHIHFSQERLYMAILMGSAMTIIMLGWMWKMHPDRRVNVGIIAGALVVGAAAFHFSQTQAVVYDANYMRGMIPPSLDRHPDERARRDPGRPGPEARRRNHRGAEA